MMWENVRAALIRAIDATRACGRKAQIDVSHLAGAI
jgi:hypothetical protein